MPFSITQIDAAGNALAPGLNFTKDARLGSAADNEIKAEGPAVLAHHCQICRHGLEFQLRLPHGAKAVLNGAEVAEPQTLLVNGSVIAVGGQRFRFAVVLETAKRSWGSELISLFAVSLLALMLLFEALIILWLPKRLNSDQAWEREAAQHEINQQVDYLRASAKDADKKFKTDMDTAMLKLIKSCLDDYAVYLNNNREAVSREQLREIKSDFTKLERLIRKWKVWRGNYVPPATLDPGKCLQQLLAELPPA